MSTFWARGSMFLHFPLPGASCDSALWCVCEQGDMVLSLCAGSSTEFILPSIWASLVDLAARLMQLQFMHANSVSPCIMYSIPRQEEHLPWPSSGSRGPCQSLQVITMPSVLLYLVSIQTVIDTFSFFFFVCEGSPR